MDEMQKMMRNKVEESGEIIAKRLQDVTARSVHSYGDKYQAVTLSIFAIVMKYLEDNSEKLNLSIPSDLRVNFLARKDIECYRLREYLSEVQNRLGIDVENNYIYDEIVRCGLMEKRDYLSQVFYLTDEMDFSREYGGSMALEAAASLVGTLNSNSYGGLQTIPTPVIRILSRISELEYGMNCYGITDDSAMTLSQLTVGKGCNMVSETSSHYNSALSYMFLILASGRSRIKVLNNPVKWLPLGLKERMGSFDRVYAFPPVGQKDDVREILYRREWEAADFVEWVPDRMNCGEWLYARHMVKALNSTGIGYILFPLGSCSKMGVYRDVREMFIKNNMVDAVVELPPGTACNTMMTSALIVIKKNRCDKSVFMLNLGTSAGKKLIRMKRGTIEYLDADEIARIILERIERDGLSREVMPEEIEGNGYSFSPSAYVEEAVNLDALADNYRQLLKRGEELKEQYDDACKTYDAAMIQFDNVLSGRGTDEL